METYPGREKLARELGLDPQTASSGPLLAAVLHKNTSQSLTPVTRQLNFPDPVHVSQPVSETSQIVTSGVATSAIATSLSTDSTPIFTQSSTVTGGIPNVGLGLHEHEPGFQTFKLSHTTQPNDILYKGGGSTLFTGTSTTHTTTTSIGLNTNENSNLTSGLEPRITSGLGTSTTSNGQPPSPLAQKSLGTDLEHPGISVGLLQEQGVRAELGESFLDSADSSFGVLNKSGDMENLLKPTHASELNDFFALPLSSVPGDKGITGYVNVWVCVDKVTYIFITLNNISYSIQCLYPL